jgi:hypothetical protein
MRPFLLTGAGAAILLLSGCMVGPKYVKPTAPLAPSFKETTDWKEGDGWTIGNPTMHCRAESGGNSMVTQS